LLKISVTALAAATLALGAAGCTGDRVDDDPAVVATVGGTPITIGTVDKYLPLDDGPPVHTEVAPPRPRQVALDKAIRDELFAKEAQARRLPSTPEGGRSGRIRALIEQERAAHRLTAEHIGDEPARNWYEERHHLFDSVASMAVTWARLENEHSARELLGRASGMGQENVLAALEERRVSGVGDFGTATMEHDGDGVDDYVARIAFALPQAGKTGIVEGDNGQWWFARVDTVRLIAPPWDETFAHRIKTAMAWDAEQRHLTELETELRAKWEVRIFPDRLSRTEEAR
jgi:hypothetical protein